MLIDWFTVIAQLINFLILVWLLKRFLYKPILNAIDAREKRIADELAAADASNAEAQKEREEFQRKNDEFDAGLVAKKSKLAAEVVAERKQLVDAARSEADSLRSKRLAALDSEFQALNADIARRIHAEVFAIARQTLRDLAGTELEAQMVSAFVRRLGEMDADEKVQLAATLPASAVVRSAFELLPEQRTLLATTVQAAFAADTLQVGFETVPDLISGIELLMQGRKVAWSIAEHLATLDKSVGELLQAQRRSDNKAT